MENRMKGDRKGRTKGENKRGEQKGMRQEKGKARQVREKDVMSIIEKIASKMQPHMLMDSISLKHRKFT